MTLQQVRTMKNLDKPAVMAGDTAAPSRRYLLSGAAAALATSLLPSRAAAKVPAPYDWNASPPAERRADYIDWMIANRGEDRMFLGQRWDRLKQLIAAKDLCDARNIRAYLMTPREEFVTRENLGRTYEGHYLNIGFGVTITGPPTVSP